MSSNTYKAKLFCIGKHKGQNRKFHDEPYSFHPIQVANTLSFLVPDDYDLICAGYLHDTIEDTETTATEIQRMFNKTISKLVMEVTDDKEEYAKSNKINYQSQKILSMSDEAYLLKLCDIYCNLSDIFSAPLEFSKKYCHEKKSIMDNVSRKKMKFFTRNKRQIRIMVKSIYDIIALYESINGNCLFHE